MSRNEKDSFITIFIVIGTIIGAIILVCSAFGNLYPEPESELSINIVILFISSIFFGGLLGGIIGLLLGLLLLNIVLIINSKYLKVKNGLIQNNKIKYESKLLEKNIKEVDELLLKRDILLERNIESEENIISISNLIDLIEIIESNIEVNDIKNLYSRKINEMNEIYEIERKIIQLAEQYKKVGNMEKYNYYMGRIGKYMKRIGK